MVAAFKALADPTRLEILRLVGAQSGPTCVCDIVDHFDRSQPTISHHLKVLREAGWLTQTKMGIWAFYAIDSRAQALLAQAEGLLGLSSQSVEAGDVEPGAIAS
jgi:ArsR family transcriptional regulator